MYYNLLVQGFRAGQLNLKKEVPPGLAALADPYDPSANSPYQVLDLSYYKGKFYLYFGVTPAVLLFWPCVALTGHYLLQKDAAVIFCIVGFLTSTGLLWALWRRYFTEVSVGMVAAGTLALGLATGTPSLLARCGVYEVPISCGYALTMLAVAAIWKALHEPRQRVWWLAGASLVYGLAVGARPSLLPGAVILLVPVVQSWREHRKVWVSLIGATVPIALIGLGLLLYNALRFDNPFEFGIRYQLAGERQVMRQFFRLRYLWFNLWIFFLEPVRWSARFPFVHDMVVRTVPEGFGRIEHPFGILTNVPLAWMALAVPLAWRVWSTEARSIVRWFVSAVALLFGTCAVTVSLFGAANARYEVEFLPALVLLAVVGVLGVEHALAPTSEPGLPVRRVWRWAARGGWGLLLGFSVAFNLLASVARCAEAHNDLGYVLNNQGRVSEAVAHFEKAVRLEPDYGEAQYNLGVALSKLNRMPEAIEHWQQAVRIAPHFAEARNNLGFALLEQGKVAEAVAQFEQALRIKPDYAEVHNNLGNALMEAGRATEAMEQYKQALRINSDYSKAHYNLGLALEKVSRLQEALGHYEQALRLNPDDAVTHDSLGRVLMRLGRVQEAVEHWTQALRLRPDYVEAHNNLGSALLGMGRVQEAIGHYKQALRIKPDYAKAHYNLGIALEQEGRMQEARGQYEQALRLNPEFVEARTKLARLQAGQ